MSKDTCYLTDEETAKRVEIIEEKNKAYIEGFGYVLPAKTKTIIFFRTYSNSKIPLCCYVPFIKSKPLSPTKTQEEGITHQ